jgi:two-component system, OmpR family, torCAD operon response regulator TorR
MERQMSKPKHILVVEDNDVGRNSVTNTLKTRGYEVSSVPDAASMRALIDTETGIDAVVLDASHLGESGTSLALYAKGHRLPVVMMSGTKSAMVFAEQHGLQLLLRPFRPEQLDAALNQVMGSGLYGRGAA